MTRRCAIWRMELPCWCSPARSMAQALAGTGRRKALRFKGSARSSPRATSGSTALTWWEWGSFPCSLRSASRPTRSASLAESSLTSRGFPRRSRPDLPAGRELTVHARREDGSRVAFRVSVRIDTPQELLYYQHGGILHFVLRQLLGGRHKARALGGELAEPARPTNSGKVEEGSRESFPASDPPAY